MVWVAAVGWLLAGSLAMAAFAARRRLDGVARAEHELRGPLAALAMGVEQVRRGRAGRELAGVLDAQLDRTGAGLADLAAALGRGAGTRPPARVSIERLARHSAAGWDAIAGEDGRRLRLDWRAGPVTVAADRGRLAQAIGNLLSNAIEHGGGEVELRGRRVGGAVRIEVADSGGPNRRTEVHSGGANRPARPAARGGAAVRPVRWQPSRSAGRGRGRGLGIAARAVEESGGSLELLTGSAGTTAAFELPLDEP